MVCTYPRIMLCEIILQGITFHRTYVYIEYVYENSLQNMYLQRNILVHTLCRQKVVSFTYGGPNLIGPLEACVEWGANLARASSKDSELPRHYDVDDMGLYLK